MGNIKLKDIKVLEREHELDRITEEKNMKKKRRYEKKLKKFT